MVAARSGVWAAGAAGQRLVCEALPGRGSDVWKPLMLMPLGHWLVLLGSRLPRFPGNAPRQFTGGRGQHRAHPAQRFGDLSLARPRADVLPALVDHITSTVMRDRARPFFAKSRR